MTNDIARQLALFDGFEPFAGYVPRGFIHDWLGSMHDGRFRAMWGIDPTQVGGGEATTSCPTVDWGEGFFEAVSWFEAARAARGSYTMITLGACYGAQAVGAYLALQRLNPMPAKLVAVEAEPENYEWTRRHFRDNGIDPDQHWLINCALSDSNKPVLFPVGAPGSGINNCIATNSERSRQIYAAELAIDPDLPDIVRNLIITGKTGIEVTQVPEEPFHTDVEFVSAVTLADILGPFERVDLLESDIQQSESVVFPPAMDLVKAKVKRVHLATHGAEVHAQLLPLFIERGFEIETNYEPNTHHDTPWGSFDINDGIIIARNPNL
jgi:FkbM family methyltransferase